MLGSLKVRDYMHVEPVTFMPETDLFNAVDSLLLHQISSASVLNQQGDLVGVLSESDCLRAVLSGSYFEEAAGTVGSLMSTEVETVDIDDDILVATEHFINKRRRRLRVVENGRLVGQISRRDVLQALKSFNQQGAPKRV